MDVYSRHVFKQITSTLFLILISLTVIVWMATALRQLKLVTTQGQNFVLFFKMTTLALPSLMSFIIPIALLIACLHVLKRLGDDSELIVMNAGGATIWRVAKPYLVLSVFVALVLLFINVYLQPYSMRTLRDYIIKVRTDLISQVLQAGQFTTPEKGLTFHIRERSLKEELLGLAIYDTRDASQSMTYLAERGVIEKDGKSAYLIMYKGHIQRTTPNGKGAQIIAFDKYLFDLNQLGANTKKRKVSYKPRETYTYELLFPDKKNHHYRKKPGKFRSELHERFASPLYPILFAMIAVAILGRVKSNRRKSMSGVFIAFGLAIGAKVIGVTLSNLVTKDASAVPLVYAVPILFFVGMVIYAYTAMRQRAKIA